MLPNKFNPVWDDEPRLVIPFLDKNKKLIGYQGRALKSSDKSIRYITIMLDPDKASVWGLDRVDFNRRYYAVEGPFDAMFIDNCMASCGADIVAELEKLRAPKERGVVIYDNEPRSIHTVAKINRAIVKGWKVVIWPDHISEKDINDMVMTGLPVQQIIAQNIYSGMEAELRLADWKRT
jgi:hypothetical protein